MARIAQAQQIQLDNESKALAFFQTLLGALPDPRRPQGVRYPLESVVVIALMAMVCGSDDAESMQAWGEANEDWLRGFLKLPHGTPTQDIFLSVFAALNPESFAAVFRAWAALLAARLQRAGMPTGKHIAVDGKTSRRSGDSGKGQPTLHVVSAWCSEAGLVLGQCRTADKSNEITAIPELLALLDLRGATITIDAMGCQTEIAKTIVDGGGDYVLSVKDHPSRAQRALKRARAARDRTGDASSTHRPSIATSSGPLLRRRIRGHAAMTSLLVRASMSLKRSKRGTVVSRNARYG